MKKKIGVVSLGCPKNLVDSEVMLGMLEQQDYEITNNKEEADVLVVNTCGFIESAKQESINTILEMAECKQHGCKLLIVTGCMAERYKDEIIKQIPEVDAVVGTGNYSRIAEVIEKAYSGEKPVLYGNLNAVDYLDNQRLLSNRTGVAYLKIAEGCDNCCTYCVIPKLRGSYRSRSLESISEEARSLASEGVKEVILVAQDTTRYGIDLYGNRKLIQLIRDITSIEGIEWIRILYCYPEEITDSLIEEIANNKKVCKYIDIPIQHSSDKILKKMGRRGGSEDIKNLIKKLRDRIPDIIIRTSLIVGFPDENEDDFDSLYQFVKEYEFDRLGVFTYSKEEDTAAAKIKRQVSKRTKEKRYKTLMSLQQKISEKKNRLRLNETYPAIVQGVSDDGIFYFGRTYAEAPDIDGVIYFTSQQPLNAGDIVKVKILNYEDYDLIGEVINESAK